MRVKLNLKAKAKEKEEMSKYRGMRPVVPQKPSKMPPRAVSKSPRLTRLALSLKAIFFLKPALMARVYLKEIVDVPISSVF